MTGEVEFRGWKKKGGSHQSSSAILTMTRGGKNPGRGGGRLGDGPQAGGGEIEFSCVRRRRGKKLWSFVEYGGKGPKVLQRERSIFQCSARGTLRWKTEEEHLGGLVKEGAA